MISNNFALEAYAQSIFLRPSMGRLFTSLISALRLMRNSFIAMGFFHHIPNAAIEGVIFCQQDF
jgi:hypothetical protein